jgi:hypothetical protein
MVRTVITPGQADVSFKIPENYIGKRVEITCLPLDDFAMENKPKATLGEFFGLLSAEDAQSLREHTKRVREEWDRLM